MYKKLIQNNLFTLSSRPNLNIYRNPLSTVIPIMFGQMTSNDSPISFKNPRHILSLSLSWENWISTTWSEFLYQPSLSTLCVSQTPPPSSTYTSFNNSHQKVDDEKHLSYFICGYSVFDVVRKGGIKWKCPVSCFSVDQPRLFL